MISNQTLQNTIDGLHQITKVDFAVVDSEGGVLASTLTNPGQYRESAVTFAISEAESQVVSGCQFFKVYDEQQLEFIVLAKGTDEEEAAALMGAKGTTIFRKITFPHIKWAFLYGVVLCAARAMGEFGAVSVISGHLRGKTNTLPLHVEILFNEFKYVPAFAVSSILVLMAIAILIIRSVVEYKGKKDA